MRKKDSTVKKLTVLISFIVLTAACNSSHKQQKNYTSGNISAIDSLITQEINQQHFAGAAIRVQRGDSVLHRKAYGYARRYNINLQEIDHPEPMTPGHLFDLASLTKVCATTLGIMMLVDDGQIQLNDAIHKWLPEFNNGEKTKITIRHLLTHSAGLYQWKPTYYHAENKSEQYQYIAELPLKWEVGQARHYSDLGFMLLGEIIEIISNQSLNVFLKERLYEPLNLQRTTFNPLEKGLTKIAATSHGNPFEHRMVYNDSFGYHVDVDPQSWDGWRKYTLQGQVNDGNAWYGAGGMAGHAGLFSNVDDVQKLVSLLLNEGAYGEKQLISSSVIDTFLTKNEFDNGLGWAMDLEVIATDGAPAGTFGHTGFTGTNIVAIPSNDLSIILLTNRQHVGPQENGYYYDLDQLRQQLLDAVLN